MWMCWNTLWKLRKTNLLQISWIHCKFQECFTNSTIYLRIFRLMVTPWCGDRDDLMKTFAEIAVAKHMVSKFERFYVSKPLCWYDFGCLESFERRAFVDLFSLSASWRINFCYVLKFLVASGGDVWRITETPFLI